MFVFAPRKDSLTSGNQCSNKPFLRRKCHGPGWLSALLSVWFGIASITYAAPNHTPPQLRQASEHTSTSVQTALTLPPTSTPFQVQWLSHHESHTTPQQVKGRETITLSFHFSHITGASKAYLVYRNLSSTLFSKPHKIRIKRFARPLQTGTGLFRWSLQKLPFGPGDLVEYFIEVEGHSDYSCVQRGRSARRYLKFFSPVEQHCKIMQQEKKLLDHMVDFLADLIEVKVSEEAWETRWLRYQRLHQRSTNLLRKLDQLVRFTEQDQMAHPYSFQTINTLRRRWLQRHQVRRKLLYRVCLNPSPCKKLTMQRVLHQLLQQEIQGQERDIHAVQRFLYKQESDLVDLLRLQLSQAHRRVRRLAALYQQYHHPTVKKALTAALRHLDRLLREVKQNVR